MADNNDWVDVVNTPSKRRRDRAEEIAKDPMRERNYGPVRQDSGLAPLKEKTTWRTMKDTLRGWVGMSTKDEERRKKRQKENEKKLQAELQAQHDNKGGRRRTRRRRGGRRRRTRRSNRRSRRRRKRRRRKTRRRRRRRRKQRGGFDPIPKFRYKPKVFLNASAPKEAPIPPKPWW